MINSTLNKREREIIRYYHGIGGDCLTWVDIGKQYVYFISVPPIIFFFQLL